MPRFLKQENLGIDALQLGTYLGFDCPPSELPRIGVLRIFFADRGGSARSGAEKSVENETRGELRIGAVRSGFKNLPRRVSKLRTCGNPKKKNGKFDGQLRVLIVFSLVLEPAPLWPCPWLRKSASTVDSQNYQVAGSPGTQCLFALINLARSLCWTSLYSLTSHHASSRSWFVTLLNLELYSL